jgi:hypothetical protein
MSSTAQLLVPTSIYNEIPLFPHEMEEEMERELALERAMLSGEPEDIKKLQLHGSDEEEKKKNDDDLEVRAVPSVKQVKKACAIRKRAQVNKPIRVSRAEEIAKGKRIRDAIGEENREVLKKMTSEILEIENGEWQCTCVGLKSIWDEKEGKFVLITVMKKD